MSTVEAVKRLTRRLTRLFTTGRVRTIPAYHRCPPSTHALYLGHATSRHVAEATSPFPVLHAIGRFTFPVVLRLTARSICYCTYLISVSSQLNILYKHVHPGCWEDERPKCKEASSHSQFKVCNRLRSLPSLTCIDKQSSFRLEIIARDMSN